MPSFFFKCDEFSEFVCLLVLQVFALTSPAAFILLSSSQNLACSFTAPPSLLGHAPFILLLILPLTSSVTRGNRLLATDLIKRRDFSSQAANTALCGDKQHMRSLSGIICCVHHQDAGNPQTPTKTRAFKPPAVYQTSSIQALSSQCYQVNVSSPSERRTHACSCL